MALRGTSSQVCSTLERLFLRLASIEDDSKLEAFVQKHLLDIIQYMSTGEPDVRNKGMELLTHLSRRIKSNLSVILPLEDILQYLLVSCTQGNVLGTNIAIVYLRMALGRADSNKHITVLPKLLDVLVKYGSNKKVFDQLVVLTARAWLAVAEINQARWPSLEALTSQAIKAEVLRFFSDVLFFSDTSGERRSMATQLLNNFSNYPCMSKNGFVRITKDLLSDPLVNITALKLAVVKVITSGIFAEAEILPLLIGAVALGPDEVEIAGDVAIKRIDLDEVLNSKDVVKSLFNLYLGGSSQGGVESDRVLPATVPIQLKIMPLLMRSPAAVKMFPCNMKVAFNGLFNKCSDGIKPLKLQQASIEFLLQMVKNFPADALSVFGPVMFSSLRKLIDQSKFASVVAIAYQCLGIIGCSVPKLVVDDMALLQETFDAIPEAPEEVSSAIRDCLVSWLPVFFKVDDVALVGVLQALVSVYIAHESPRCRLVALKYAEVLLKTPSLEFLWLLCRSCGDPRDELKREAVRLLDLSVSVPTAVPKFEDLVEFIHRKLNLKYATNDHDSPAVEVKKKKEAFADEVFYISALYLYTNVQVACSLDPISLTEANVVSSAADYPTINAFLVNSQSPATVHRFLETVMKAIESQPADILIDIACLLLQHGSLDGNYRVEILTAVEQHLNSNARTAICSRLALLYTLILNDKERKCSLVRLYEELCCSRDIPVRIPWLCSFLVSLTSPGVADDISRTKCQIVNLVETMLVQPNQLFEAACGSLAELLRRALFTLNDVERAKMVSVSDIEFCSLCELLGKITTSRKDSLTPKMKESAVHCLGFLSSLSLQTDLYEKVLAHLFASGELATQPDLQFTVGEALVDATFGESSASRRNVFIETEQAFLESNISVDKRTIIEKKVANLLEVLVNEKLCHSNRHLRQSALIWLFVLVRRCADVKLNCLMSALNLLQRAFINGLTETDEFSQEVASRGLGIIFELATEEGKKVMIEELIDSLSVGRKRAVPVVPDTQLFGKGELGATLTGENLTTYRELCNLATDLNQPDLIYKFMQLANHNVLWNSKKGAALGFDVVMQQAKSSLEPYFAQLVPKLFRYRYDPDLKVQGSMCAIWRTITSSKKSVIEEYADTIFKELLSTLTYPQWRTRESSCLALADLLAAHCTNGMVELFSELFHALYQLQDDVKESVRVAGGRALSTLAKVTIRKCASANGARATSLLGVVLPVIVDKGIRSSIKENKMLSLQILMDISKEAGSALHEHLNVIVPCLLDSLSETEPPVLNYVAARSSLDELEVLDTARASVAHSSPIMTAIRDVVPHIDEDVFNTLSDRLMEQLRSSVGVTTRTGTCQFIIDLCLRRQQLLMSCQATCDKIVRVLLNGLSDRNLTIKKHFSSCLSYLLPFCCKAEASRVLDYIKQKLQTHQDDDEVAVLHLLRSLSKNTEILNEWSTVIVPYIFLHKFQSVAKDNETGKKRLEMWNELWSQLVPDTNSAIRLYRKEMIEVAVTTLNTSSIWAVKAQAAMNLAAIADSDAVGADVSDADMLYDTVTSALQGRVWNGKEKLLEAVSAVLRSSGGKLALKWDEVTTEKRFAPLWKECLKKNRKYSAGAVQCAAIFCEITRCSKIALQVLSLIENNINYVDSEMFVSDDDGDGNEKSSAFRQDMKNDYLIRITSAIAHVLLAFDGGDLKHGIDLVVDLLKSEDTFWKVKQSVIIELTYFLERCASLVDLTSLFLAVASLLLENVSQRHTFALQCCAVLERIAKLAEAKECISSVGIRGDVVSKLKSTAIVQTSAILTSFLNEGF